MRQAHCIRLSVVAWSAVRAWSAGQDAQAISACGDYKNQCYMWALQGHCKSKADFMEASCPASCGTGVCLADAASKWNRTGLSAEFDVQFEHALHETKNALELLWVPPKVQNEGRKINVVATIQKGERTSLKTFEDHVFLIREAGTQKKLAITRMFSGRTRVVVDKTLIDAKNGCADQLPDCKQRVSAGHCAHGPGWMIVNCPKSCHACALRLPQNRCERHTLNMDPLPAVQPGDIQALFEGLVDRFPQYNVTVHSREPWIATFDNFVSDEEINGLLGTLGGKFARSTDQGGFDERGVQQQITSQGRTSENAWCQMGCESHPASLAIQERISNVTGVPSINFEQFQVLSYRPGQFYNPHNDMSDSDNNMPAGPRIYTFFLYFSDVEEGGETAFPQVGIKIRPKKGSAVLWNDVRSENPTRIEPKSLHEAVAVKQGHKIAANAWVHLWNYREPNRWGCTGSFS